MSFTDTVASSIIDFVTKRGTPTYLTLLSADIVNTDTMATMPEITGGGLTRVSTSWTVPARAAGADVSTPLFSNNNNDSTFGPLTAAMTATATVLALVTAQTGTTGTILRTWQMATPWQGGVGDTLTIPTNTIQISAR